MNKFYTSDGEAVTQATIKQRLREAYAKHDDGTYHCRGCNMPANAHAHILSQVRCKNLGHAEWIWQPWNWFKACHACNSNWESYKGEACKNLHNYSECLLILKNYDNETYLKYTTFNHL